MDVVSNFRQEEAFAVASCRADGQRRRRQRAVVRELLRHPVEIAGDDKLHEIQNVNRGHEFLSYHECGGHRLPGAASYYSQVAASMQT